MVKRRYLSVILLSDAHLFGSRDKELFGVNTFHKLELLSGHIRRENRKFDLLVVLGDVSEDGDPKAYTDFYDLTRELGAKTVWMKGNHDDFSSLPGSFTGQLLRPEWEWGRWRMIFLDSTLPGKDEGKLEANEMGRLVRFLEHDGDRPVLVFLHHQPVDVGTRFIDELGLMNKEQFWEVVGWDARIKAVLFGHVHQPFEGEYMGIRLFSIPSTGMQFKPGSDTLAFDDPWQGYRTLDLYPDGTLETRLNGI